LKKKIVFDSIRIIYLHFSPTTLKQNNPYRIMLSTMRRELAMVENPEEATAFLMVISSAEEKSSAEQKTPTTSAGITAEGAFHNALDALGESFTPFSIVASNGDVIRLVVKTKTDPGVIKKMIQELQYGNSPGCGLRCRTCAEWMRKHSGLHFEEGSPFSCVPCGPYRELADASHGPFKGFKVVTGPMREHHDGSYVHFELTPAPSVLTHFTAQDYEWFLHQYVGTLMRSLQTNGRQGILESLTLLIETLGKVNYGDKIIYAVRWYASAMEAWMAVPYDAPRFAREIVVAQALVKARLEKGHGHERIVCTSLHQMLQNGLDALATANSVEGLRRLLESRFSPATYMRRTGPASTGQLTEAMDHFSGCGFTMPKLMSTAELVSSYGGVAVATDQPTASALDVWAASAARLKKKTASNFANRAAASHFIAPNTFEEIETRIMAGDMPGLEVQMNGQTPINVTSYEQSARALFKYPYFWSFRNKSNPEIYGLPNTGFCKVNAIAFPGRSVFIGIVGAVPAAKMGNTCFPSYLASAHARKCGPAFEELNKQEMLIPSDCQEFALGIGESRVDESGRACGTMTFRWKSHVFGISRFS